MDLTRITHLWNSPPRCRRLATIDVARFGLTGYDRAASYTLVGLSSLRYTLFSTPKWGYGTVHRVLALWFPKKTKHFRWGIASLERPPSNKYCSSLPWQTSALHAHNHKGQLLHPSPNINIMRDTSRHQQTLKLVIVDWTSTLTERVKGMGGESQEERTART